MPNESNMCFHLVISGVGRGVSERGAGGFLRSQNVSGVWLDAEEEITASNGCIACNFKPFRGHTFMMATKNYQFCDSPPHPLHPQK